MALSKRERTRREIAECAFTLFAEQGYDNTTVAQIVKAAGVSHMTFFRNFPTRAHVVISTIDVALLTRLVAAAPLHMGAFDCMCWVWLHFSRIVSERAGSGLGPLSIIANSESLSSEVFGPSSPLTHRIAAALRGRGVEEWDARISASAMLGAAGGAINRCFDYNPDINLLSLADTMVRVLVPDVKTRESIYREVEENPLT